MIRDEDKERETCIAELLNTLEHTDQELNNHIIKMEIVRENLSNQLKDAK